ncbi:TIM-barrel domain-containing protein [Paenibacillus sp. GCM10027628]|uniref:glycoside hydrolase family 31 protein n=1 Tax=Paenibacillus sp. GCM10027628 TaxID=3273413 RepID=UPI00363B260B
MVNTQGVRDSHVDYEIEGLSGEVTIRGQRANLRDMAFLCYALVQRGDAERALALLRHLIGCFGKGQGDLTDAALALWAAGEYIKATGDHDFRDERKVFIEGTVHLIASNWQKPQPHWLQGDSHGIYLSHLAMYYAGIQSNAQHGELGEKLLKSIRELVFAKFIKDGRVVSALGDTAIHGDIIAAAIPFGMLGIEDRILIEALYKLEEMLVGKGVRLSTADTYYGGCERPDLTCLLALYYAKKGDTARAKELLTHVEALLKEHEVLYEVDADTAKEPLMLAYWRERVLGQGKDGGQGQEQVQGRRQVQVQGKDDGQGQTLGQVKGQGQDERQDLPSASALGAVLLELAQAALAAGGTSVASSNGVALVHMPTGYDDPYVTLPYERFPRHPEAGDAVLVRLLTQPFQASQVVTVQAAVNGMPAGQPVSAAVKVTADGEKVWEAQLGPYLAGDEVSYAFALQSGSKSVASPTYRFKVRSWTALERVHAMYATTDGFVVELNGADASRTVSMAFRADASGAVKLTFAAAGERIQSAPAQQAALPVGRARLEAGVREGKLALSLRSAEGVLVEGFAAEGKPLIEALTDGSGMIHKLRLNLKAKPEHRWFGMGERFSHYEYSGQEVDQYVYNQYRDQGLKTYMPVPFAISSGGYSIFVDTALYSTFRFHTRLSDLVEIEADLSPSTQQLTAYLFAGEPLEMIGQFTDISGKPVLPPKWAFGPWMSSNNWDSQAEVKKQAELTAKYQIPSTVLVIEQWSDEATFYIFNDAQYEVKDGGQSFRYDDFQFPEWGRWPNPKSMVEELHDQGLKVLLWQIPIHKFMYGVAHGQRDQDEATLLENGYCVKTADGEPYTLPYNWFKDCHIIDFTHPEAKKWWFAKRQYLVDEIKVDGFKTDGGEFVFGHDLQFHDGSTGREMRNLYPNLYVGSYYDFVQQHATDGGITFSRAGYTGAQKYPLHWAGDERSTFQAFRSSMIAGLSSSMSGIPFWGWDLGGFHGDIPSAELFVRSAQMAAFCPVMQYHAETKGEFNQDRTPWNIAERTGQPAVIELYKKYADIRMNLLPYIYDQAIRASRTGLPMMRAMSLQYPADPHCTEIISEYMFGESLLVAPVTEEGHGAKEVYFPEGEWLSLFGHDTVQGPRLMKVAAGLDHIPVYVKQNSIVALNLAEDYTLGGHVGNRVDGYEQLCFKMYVKTELQAEFEDDLGNHVKISAKREDEILHLYWSGRLQQNITFIVHQTGSVSTVSSERAEWVHVADVGQLQPGSYAQRNSDLFITIQEQAGSLVIAG